MSQPTRKLPDGWENWAWAEKIDHARKLAGLDGVEAKLSAEARESGPYILDPVTFTYYRRGDRPPVREEELPPVHESVNPVFTGPFR